MLPPKIKYDCKEVPQQFYQVHYGIDVLLTSIWHYKNHFFQPDLTAVAKVCLERLRIIADCGPDTEEMEKLRISSDSESDSDDAYRKLQEEIL